VPESLFTFLFKYRPVVFEHGRLVFETARPIVLMLGALAVAIVLGTMYLRQRTRVGGTTVAALTTIRALILTLIALALLRPALTISTVVPGENFLAVLIDDSRSMRLVDDETTTRGAQALEAFTAGSSDLLAGLRERFTLRYYRFSDITARMDPTQPPLFDGRATDIGAALDYVRQDLTGVPLAGAVLVTDGADNTHAALTDPLLHLKSRGIPVYTVGLGEESFRRDIEVTRVEAPARVLKGSSFAVDVMLHQRGYDGRTVTLIAEEDGTIAATETVTFGRGQEGTTVRLNLTATTPGPRDYRFSVEPLDDERVRENNARDILVSVADGREKILYFEGEPRWEVKFLRKAVVDDENIQLVVLQRTAENKYLRLGVDDALELTSGFPTTREQLFAYRGLILGSVEASYFTHNQLQIIEEFVSQRGGGLLLLGGRASFAEGGYAGTPLENVLPVVLEDPTPDDPTSLAEIQVSPTQSGLAHAAIQLAPTLEASTERWNTLPPLTTPNPIHRVKPGATVLLTGTSADGDDELVVLASHHYGRGRVIAFTAQDSWLWQMHADMPLEDMTHERLWRQMTRWLVSTVPELVAVETSKNQFSPGEPVTVRAEVRDSSYLGINGATVTATITDPTGAERSIPLEWTVEEDGEYLTVFVPTQMGTHLIRVDAEHGGHTLGSDDTEIRTADLTTEFFGAEMNASLLRRIADETGGRFYTTSTMAGLAEDARFTDAGNTIVEVHELWDMPVVLILMLGLIGAEWGLRRRRGLA
jgi:uncharacterized membrane protein